VSPHLSQQEFSALPLDQQTRALASALEARQSAEQLLALAASCRDHAPLAWLVTRLLQRGWLANDAQRSYLADFLLQQSETAVHKVLRDVLADATHPQHVEALLLGALERVTVKRLSTMCLLDRSLKHNFTETRDTHVDKIRSQVEKALAAGDVASLTVDALAQISGRAIDALRDTARRHSQQTLSAFDDLRRQLAKEAIGVLENAPKAVSQANAEELLSRRVYTDPGHFLIELLQNAEDAGASTWRVVFDADRVIVWHDGAPFDARDLVGVTSIGQTTKRKSQIGFFGVGFKAVYEITNRPRIYSDVYQFEIADVSIPKWLGTRPADVPQSGTVLVLPLRDPDDPVRCPAALYDKARAIDPCVLFTLRRIDKIDLELTAAATGSEPRHHIVTERAPDAQKRSQITLQTGAGQAGDLLEPAGQKQSYAILDDRYAYDGPRDAGRPDSTPIMIGIALDEHGLPKPLEPDDSTVYSYLPTDEHSGLRFFVQAHFDVPVDRERITPDSGWNRWILSKVPAQLKKAAELLCGDPERAPHAHRLLDVLPLSDELHSPIFAAICETLPKALHDSALLPCLDGARHPARQSVIASEAISDLLRGAALPGQLIWPLRAPNEQQPGFILRGDLDERTLSVARLLGCGELRFERLLDLLELSLAPNADEALPFAALRAGDVWAFWALHEVLLDGVGRLDENKQTAISRLRRLPILLDDSGQPVAAARCFRANDALRTIYRGRRPLLHPALDPAVTPITDEAILQAGQARDLVGEDAANKNDTRPALLSLLGVAEIGHAQLLSDLESAVARFAKQDDIEGSPSVLSAITDLDFFTSVDQLAQVFEVLQDAPKPTLSRAAALPLFVAQDQRYHRLARTRGDVAGAIVAPADQAIASQLAALYGDLRAIVRFDPNTDDDTRSAIIGRIRVPELDLHQLLSDLSQAPERFTASEEAIIALHRVLAQIADELSERARRQFARLPIWPDHRGLLRRLTGREAALLPKDDAVAALFDDAPLLPKNLRPLAHVTLMGAKLVDAQTVVEALWPRAKPPLCINFESSEKHPAALVQALRYLLAHADDIEPAGRRLLPNLEVFFDDTGIARAPSALYDADQALRQIYKQQPQSRAFLAKEGLARDLLAVLDLQARVRVAAAPELISDLQSVAEELSGLHVDGPDAAALPLLDDRDGLYRCCQYLTSQLAELSKNDLWRLGRLPIFIDEKRTLGPLARLDQIASAPPRQGELLVCSAALRPPMRLLDVRLLDEQQQLAWAPLFSALDHAPFDVDDLLDWLLPLSPIQAGGFTGEDVRPGGFTGEDVRPGDPRCALQTSAALTQIQSLLADKKMEVKRRHLLERLAIWETVSGAVVSASVLVERAAFEAFFQRGSDERALLDSCSVEGAPAVRLAALELETRDSGRFFEELLEALGRPSRPLELQPPFLSSVDKIRALLEAFFEHGVVCTKLPIVDATGHLQLRQMHRAESSTAELLDGLSICHQIVDPRLTEPLLRLGIELPKLSMLEVLEALLPLDDETDPASNSDVPLANASRRARFYAWLVENEGEVFSRKRCRAHLQNAAFLPAKTGELCAASELVFDERLLSLGLTAARPADEIPKQTLTLLSRQLDLGRARPSHLQSALAHPIEDADQSLALARVAADIFADPEQHAQLLDIEALRSASWLCDQTGRPRRAEQLYLPSMALEAIVGPYPELYVAPLIVDALGSRLAEALPFRAIDDIPLDFVLRHLDDNSNAGTALPFAVYRWLENALAEQRIDRAELADRLSGSAWIFSDDGLYFNHRHVVGERALQLFGTRRGSWQRGLQSCPTLAALFEIKPTVDDAFICAFIDELGQAALEDDQALLQSEPALSRMLLACYAELGEKSDGALPNPQLPSVLCRLKRADDDRENKQRLMPATKKGLLLSDTPTLEAMFASAGRLFLAEAGSGERRQSVERFLARMGVRTLRQAYQIEVDQRSGQDVSDQHRAAIAALRDRLRSLTRVLPRVQKQRGGDDEHWRYDSALSALGEAASIRAVNDLRVRFVLPGVGDAPADVNAVYDERAAALLMQPRVLEDPARYATDLALGLMPAIYQGPREDELVDIIVLLLPLATYAQMNEYLDLRHYPVSPPEMTPRALLGERIGELFDFGLTAGFQQRFENELTNVDLTRWRDSRLLDSAAIDLPEQRSAWARLAATRLLALLSIDASEALAETLATLLAADSVDEIPENLLSHGTQAANLSPTLAGEPPLDLDLPSAFAGREHGPSPAENDAPERRHPAPSDGLSALFSELEHIASIKRQTERETQNAPAVPQTGRQDADLLSLYDLAETSTGSLPPAAELEAAIEALDADDIEIVRQMPIAVEPPPPSLWQRMVSFFRSDDSAVELSEVMTTAPDWATSGQNAFAPQSAIGPQLWATRDTMRAISERPLQTRVHFDPPLLPRPYLYAVARSARRSTKDAKRGIPKVNRLPSTTKRAFYRDSVSPCARH
jgi:hypothetical protein